MSAQTETWPRPHRLTVDEYYRMAEVGLLSPGDRTELIEGEIIDMPPIGPTHASVVVLLTKRLVRMAGDAVEVRAQQPVRFMPRSEPQPDFALVVAKPGRYRETHPIASDVLLLIEVSDSTLRFDLDVKARLYAKHGVREYWVVDLVHNRVWRHRRPKGQQYTEREEIETGVLELPDGLGTIAVAELF
jgi:Uma2 family endonuclease